MKQFGTQLLGYNKQDVEAQMEADERQISALQNEVTMLQEQLTRIREQNQSLERQADITEKTNKEIARLALKEASELIEKAKRNANMILKESMEYVRNLSAELSEFRDQSIRFRKSVQQMSKDIIDTIDKSEVYNYISEEEEEALEKKQS